MKPASETSKDPAADTAAPTRNAPVITPYNDPYYQEKRRSFFNSIPESTLYNTIARNSGLVIQAVIATLVAVIVSDKFTPAVAIGLSAVCAGMVMLNSIAGYMDEKLSRRVNLDLNEARQIVETKMQAQIHGKEVASALSDTLGNEMNQVKLDQAVAEAKVEAKQEAAEEAAKKPAVVVVQTSPAPTANVALTQPMQKFQAQESQTVH